MIRRSWRTRLKASVTPEAVLTVVSQFLEEWSPPEIADLPEGAWPRPLVSKSDVVAHALKLGNMHAVYSGPANRLGGLQEMLLFFTHAAVRIAHLAAIASLEEIPAPRVNRVADEES
ncbi:MAG TPA: hypothetical protein VFE23_15740 [Usitatibacter sp.]|nr:hypothetical protein [Usitatibacter sp.]